MLISSDSNWPLKGSQWDEIVCVKNSYFYAPTIFIRYLWKVSSLMELTKIEDFAKLPSAKCQIAKCQNAKCQMFFWYNYISFPLQRHFNPLWGLLKRKKLVTFKDRKRSAIVLLCCALVSRWSTFEDQSQRNWRGGGYLCPHAPPTHRTTQ